jgi:hypothetical protein
MAGAQGIKAGSAYVELSVKDQISKGLDAAAGKLKAFGLGVAAVGASITAVGAAMAAPFVGGLQDFAKVGTELANMQKRTGLAVQALSELAFAARLADVEFGDVEISVKRMQKTIADAASGEKSAADALALVGLQAKNLIDLAPEDQFRRMAEAVAAIQNPTKRTQAALDLFGKSGTKILPLISDMAKLRQEAVDLGLVMTDEMAKAADELGDSWDRVGATLNFLSISLGAAIAPEITKLGNELAKIIAQVIKWAQENPELVATIAKIGAAVFAAGSVITAFGAIVGGLGFVFAGVSAAISAIVPLLPVLAVGFLVVVGAVAAAVEAFAGFMILWNTFPKTFDRVGSAIKQTFTSILDTVKTTFGAIKDALAAGDISLAFKIALQGMKVVALQITGEILGLFQKMVDKIFAAMMRLSLAFDPSGVAARALGVVFKRLGDEIKSSLDISDAMKKMKADLSGLAWLAEYNKTLAETKRRMDELNKADAQEDAKRGVKIYTGKQKGPDKTAMEKLLAPLDPMQQLFAKASLALGSNLEAINAFVSGRTLLEQQRQAEETAEPMAAIGVDRFANDIDVLRKSLASVESETFLAGAQISGMTDKEARTKGRIFDIAQALDFDSIGDAVGEATARASSTVLGQFGGEGVMQVVGGTDAAEQTAENTKATADNTKKTITTLENVAAKLAFN